MAAPKTSRVQQQRRDKSRAKILAAAEQVFARDGLAGARTDAIAAEAKVNKALLYYYFKSKESLYEAVVEEHMRAFNEKALELLNAPGLSKTILLRYVDMHFDFMSQHRRHAALFQQVMMRGGKPPERLCRKYIVPRSAALRNLLERGQREREFRRADPFHTAISIAALIVFYFSASPVLQVLGFGDPYSPAALKRRKEEVLNFVRYALFVDPELPSK